MTARTAPDPQHLKDAMSRFTTGVTVVTTRHEGVDYGMTCNSFNTVSLDPPLVMWCIRKSSQSHAAFTQPKLAGQAEQAEPAAARTGYVVSVLAADQHATAMKFTQGSQAERFEGVSTQATPSGRARIDGAVAWFDCTLEQTVSAGDHDILIGRVRAVGTHDAPGLAYARRQFGVLAAV
jgi:flavin reductase (DIM6/NTAB) family NADH-FMN oxidoreductase RutF